MPVKATPARVLAAAAILLGVAAALDCAWQRALVPRLMGLQGVYLRDGAREGEPGLTAIDADIAAATLERRRRDLGTEAFRVAWSGHLDVEAPGEYTFYVGSGGAVSLFLDGVAVVESEAGGEHTGSVVLEAGRHDLLLRYAQGPGEPALSLSWARDRQPRELLAAERLLPPHPDEAGLVAYRTGRTILRWLFLAAGLVATVALLVAAALHGARAVRAGRGGIATAGAFAALLVTGAVVLDDFGVAMDETIQRQIGVVNYLYLSQGATRLFDRDFPERHYGPLFETLLVLVEKQLGLSDSRAVFLMRHGATFLLFCVAMTFFYRLCLRHFASGKLALLAAACLVSSPRIFADAFYNSKDLAFLSVFVVAAYTLVRFLDEGTAQWAFRHALASAVLIDIRVVGLVVPALTLLFAAGDLLFVRDDARPARRRVALLAAYGGPLAVLTVALFPFLWPSPLVHLGEVLEKMSQFPFRRTVLYLGQDLPAGALPWHYVPVWIGVTTPIAVLGLFAAGLVALAASCLVRPARLFGHRDTRNRLLWLLWCLGPLAAVVATKAVLYDGWRHLFFIYPALVLIAVEGAGRIATWARGRLPAPVAPRLMAVLCLLVLAEPVAFLVRHHPYGHVFFNRLAGADMRAVKQRFDLDYWGLSYRRGLEEVLRRDGRDAIRVHLRPGVGEISAAILPAADRMRLTFVERGRDAEYFLGNYRWHRGEYPWTHEVCSVRVDGAAIMTVYDLRFDRRRGLLPPAL